MIRGSPRLLPGKDHQTRHVVHSSNWNTKSFRSCGILRNKKCNWLVEHSPQRSPVSAKAVDSPAAVSVVVQPSVVGKFLH